MTLVLVRTPTAVAAVRGDESGPCEAHCAACFEPVATTDRDVVLDATSPFDLPHVCPPGTREPECARCGMRDHYRDDCERAA